MFYVLLILWIVLDVAWWRAVDRRSRAMARRAANGMMRWLARGLRMALAAFSAAMTAYMILFVVRLFTDAGIGHLPLVYHIAAYVWHLLVLPVAACWLGAAALLGWWRRRAAAKRRAAANPTASRSEHEGAAPPAPLPTRRQALAMAAAVLPPLAVIEITRRCMEQLGGFSVRRETLVIPGLPRDLDGLTIAHATDLHIGKFLPQHLPGQVADAVNAMKADLVVFTGDLIDIGKMEALPAGIDFLRRLDPRHGLAIIEGNHDIMLNARQFEQSLLDLGLPLLLDESAVFEIPGRPTPVQCLGTTWGEWKFGDGPDRMLQGKSPWYRDPSGAARADSVARLAAMRRHDAFPILLAHHPHAFDPAAAAGFPLTLAGHTHGGQIMLTDHIGAGPLRFKYWTGQYSQGDARLYISNGIGNWFPLRLNAPPQIAHLTLRRG